MFRGDPQQEKQTHPHRWCVRDVTGDKRAVGEGAGGGRRVWRTNHSTIHAAYAQDRTQYSRRSLQHSRTAT
eukprot:3664810-Rhodomonas_salina.2